jgi:hypothetical protein
MGAEKRFETRRTFIEGEGHLVEEVEIGTAVENSGAASVVTEVRTLSAADVSVELARQVCEQAGMVVVPASFLNPEQLEELNITVPGPGTSSSSPDTAKQSDTPAVRSGKLTAEQTIALVEKAESFDKLNALMADETRKTVIMAAEKRAEELKAQGAQ